MRQIKALSLTCLFFTGLAFGADLPVEVHLPVPYSTQPDNQTCLPTCLNMTLRWYGRCELTTDTIQALHKRTWYDRYNLPAIVKDYGLYALPSWNELGWKKDDIKREIAAGRPVIMGLNTGRGGHFVLAVGYTADDKLIINDPSRKRFGYKLGGEGAAVDWNDLMWRNGCMIHSEPFPPALRPISGMTLETTAPKMLRPGQIADYAVAIRNTGSEPWPVNTKLCAIDPWGNSGWLKPKSDLFEKSTWKSQSCAAEVPTTAPLVQPGEVYEFNFKVQAPPVEKQVTIHERFGLIDGTGRWFFEDYQAGPGPWNISDMIVVAPETSDTLPMQGDIPWKTKTGAIEKADLAAAGIPAPPDGKQAYFLPSGGSQGYNCAWVGNMEWKDYKVSILLWLAYDGDNKENGYTRTGLFMYDNGMHSPCMKNLTEIGVALTSVYDSDDGALRFGDSDNGYVGAGIGDVIERKDRTFLKESGAWHRVEMECKGRTVKYYFDGKLARTDTATDKFTHGDCGVFVETDGCKEPAGAYFADFKVESLR